MESCYKPVAFPLHPIIRHDDGSVSCGCGRDGCSRVGKHPAIDQYRDLQLGDEVPERAEGAGAAIKTGAAPKGSGVFVVDLDGPDAINAWSELGGFNGQTRIVKTGREDGEGVHLYFKHPGFHVKTSGGAAGGLWWNGKHAPESQAIDIRGDGGIVVVEGSPHRSGRTYELIVDAEPADAPEWLIEWFRSQPAPVEVQQYEGDIKDPADREYRKELYAKWLETAEPCIEGNGGDQRLFEVVQYGAYDLALPTEDVLELVAEVFDPRCEPPWGAELEDRVLHKAHDAKTTSTRARIEPPPNPKTDPELAALFGSSPMKSEMKAANDSTAPTKKKPLAASWGGWDKPVDPPTWLVQGLIPIETVGLFVAMGSSLKTWTALDIGRAVATGQPWLGRYPVRKGKVLIVDWESGEYELKRRMKVLECKSGNEIVDLGTLCYPDEGIGSAELWKYLASIEGLQLVIFDSLAAGAPDVDENIKEAAIPLAMAGKLAEERGVSSLFIHHTTKADGGGDKRKTVRGSTAIYAAADWAYAFDNIEEYADTDGSIVRRMKMVNIKPCMGPKPAPVTIALSNANGIAYAEDDENELDERAAVGGAGTGKSLEELKAAILLAVQAEHLTSLKTIRRKVRANMDDVTAAVEELMNAGELAHLGKRGGYKLDDEGKRRARIHDALKANPYMSGKAPSIAAAAHIHDAEIIEEMIRRTEIVRSAEGRWITRLDPLAA